MRIDFPILQFFGASLVQFRNPHFAIRNSISAPVPISIANCGFRNAELGEMRIEFLILQFFGASLSQFRNPHFAIRNSISAECSPGQMRD
jgi:hypothetical protein